MLPETRQAIPESYRVPLYPVRHQLRCNACWAFAAVCTLETALQLQLNIAQQLSEQHLVNCVNEDFICTDYSNAIKALQYVKNEYALGKREIYEPVFNVINEHLLNLSSGQYTTIYWQKTALC